MPRTLGEVTKGINKIRLDSPPAPIPGYVYHGALQSPITDKFPDYTGVKVISGWVAMPIENFLGQSVLIATTGSGKSVKLENWAYQILADPDWDIVFIDGRGDPFLAQHCCQMGAYYGLRVPVVYLGREEAGTAVFNGFNGSSAALYNRFVLMLNLEPTGTDADFYRVNKREILQMVCGVNMDDKYGMEPFDPPRSFQELERRVSTTWLEAKYKDSKEAMAVIDGLKKSDISSLRGDISVSTNSFLKILDPSGFNLGDYRLSVFSVDPSSASFDAAYFFRFLSMVIEHYQSVTRKKTVYILDEFAQLGAGNVLRAVNTGRGKNAAYILSTQSVATLGDFNTANQIIDGANLRFLMKCELDLEYLRRFGTKSVQNTSQTLKDGELDRLTINYIDRFKIDPNDLKKFDKGEAKLEYGGGIVHFRSPMNPPLPEYSPDMEIHHTIVRKPRSEVNNNPEPDKSGGSDPRP